MYGYVPNAEQTARALDGIRLTVSVFPALTFAIALGCLFFYRIDKTLEVQITNELGVRRRSFVTAEEALTSGVAAGVTP